MPCGSERVDSSNIDRFRRTPEALAFGFGVPESGSHALGDQVPLAFGDRSENRENELSSGCVGVHLLAKRNELDVECVECLQCSAQVRHRAAETIKPPADNHVESPGVSVAHEAIQRGPRILLAGNAVVHVQVKYLPTSALAILGEFAGLHRRVLTVTHRRNSRIDRCRQLPRSVIIVSDELQFHKASFVAPASLPNPFKNPVRGAQGVVPVSSRLDPFRRPEVPKIPAVQHSLLAIGRIGGQ